MWSDAARGKWQGGLKGGAERSLLGAILIHCDGVFIYPPPV